MDPLQLLADLEGLRDKIPGFLQADYEGLIASIRNIYEMSIKFVTPSLPVYNGKQSLLYHHTNVDTLHAQLNTSLASFQQIYIGQGSDAYYTAATTSVQNLQIIRDHLADVSMLHGTMVTNFDLATEAKIALVSLLIGLGVTLGILIFSGGTTAPVTIPAAILEAAGGTVSIGLLTDAEAAALAAVMGLVWATLPDALLNAAAIDLILNSLFFAKKPRSDTYNQVEDKQWRWILQQIARRIGRQLTKDEQRRLHDAISKQGYDVEEIIEIGVSMFGP